MWCTNNTLASGLMGIRRAELINALQEGTFRGTTTSHIWYSAMANTARNPRTRDDARRCQLKSLEQFTSVVPSTSSAELRRSHAAHSGASGAGAARDECGLPAAVDDS